MKNLFVKIFLIVVMGGLNSHVFGLDKDEKDAIAAIKAGNLEFIRSYMEKHPDKNCLFSNGKTGLYYAIDDGEVQIARYFLARGADPEFLVEGQSMMKWAIRSGEQRVIRYLVEYGADVNRADPKGNTPLMYAAELNNIEICKLLIDRGANPLLENGRGWQASDYAFNYVGSLAYDYLLFMKKQYQAQDTVPSMHDGPYMSWENDSLLVISYYEHIQEKHLTRLVEKTLDCGSTDTEVKGFGWDTNIYHISRRYSPDPDSIRTTGDVFTVGDVHGKYTALVRLLKNNKIIDQDLNWQFGSGQLVLLGDVFDRGPAVTETLWFLYGLDMQAKKAGGNVQLLLGNHEVMALTGDHRYLNPKYNFFFQYTQTYYYTLFDNNSVLGRWLRSQNLILRINDNLFLHAGISPRFAAYGFSLDEVNTRVRKYLETDYKIREGSPEDFILGAYGPQWYRGYGYQKGFAEEVNQQFIDGYLSPRGLSRMIVGHNEQDSIMASFEGKVISADVEIDEEGENSQGLLISGDKLYRCLVDGTKQLLE